MITQAMRFEALREIAAAEDLIARARRNLHRAIAIHGMAANMRRDLERLSMDANRLQSTLAMTWQNDCAEASYFCGIASAPTLSAHPGAPRSDRDTETP